MSYKEIIKLILVIYTAIVTYLLLEIQYTSLKNWEKEIIMCTMLILMQPFLHNKEIKELKKED